MCDFAQAKFEIAAEISQRPGSQKCFQARALILVVDTIWTINIMEYLWIQLLMLGAESNTLSMTFWSHGDQVYFSLQMSATVVPAVPPKSQPDIKRLAAPLCHSLPEMGLP